MSDKSILSTIKDAILNVKTVILCVIFSAYQLFSAVLFIFIFERDTWFSFTATDAEILIAAWRGLIIWICLFTVLTAVIMRKWKWKQWLITLPLQFVVYTLVCFLWRVLVPHYLFSTATSFVLPTVFATIDFAFHTHIYSFYSLAIFEYIFFLESFIEIFALQALGIYLYNRWSERRERRAMRAKEAKEAEKRSDTEQNKTPAPSEEDNKD